MTAVTPELLRRFDVCGPRYTSFPTADRFAGGDTTGRGDGLDNKVALRWGPERIEGEDPAGSVA